MVTDEATITKAHTLAAAVAMDAADWGPGYTRGNPYETDPAPEWEVKTTCEGLTQGKRHGTLAAINRVVKQPQTENIASTEVRVFADVATAESFLTDVESATRRCPEQYTGKTRWAGVRQATAPTVAGFDEIVAEEGRQVTDDAGEKTDFPYVVYVGRSGDTTLHVLMYDDAGNPPARLAERAAGAMKKLQQRLVANSSQ
ncbi:hypothetical protein ACF09C_16620 [Streptomyces sp. NPDC014870]|uniref:hypothetical protein n=1 Tax=Streptomyces sp. NPDC014870 TaxID=3364925 RepID=UPI0036FB34EE